MHQFYQIKMNKNIVGEIIVRLDPDTAIQARFVSSVWNAGFEEKGCAILDWTTISKKIPKIDTMLMATQLLNERLAGKEPKPLPKPIIEKYATFIDWNAYASNHNITRAQLREHAHTFDSNTWYNVMGCSQLNRRGGLFGLIMDGYRMHFGEDNLSWIIETFKPKPGSEYWKAIVWNNELSEEFIEKWEAQIYWEMVGHQKKLSRAFIRKHKDRFGKGWYYICRDRKLSEDFIEEFIDYIVWEKLTYNKLTEGFIRKHIIHMKELGSDKHDLSEEFIDWLDENHPDTLNWCAIVQRKNLSEAFIRRHEKYFIEEDHSTFLFQKLNEPYIIELVDKLLPLYGDPVNFWRSDTFKAILNHQEISEEFVLRYENQIPNDSSGWVKIVHYAPLSENYIRELIARGVFDGEEKYEWSDSICWSVILQNKHLQLSEDFFREYIDKIRWRTMNDHYEFSEKFKKDYPNLLVRRNWDGKEHTIVHYPWKDREKNKQKRLDYQKWVQEKKENPSSEEEPSIFREEEEL